MGLIDEKLDNVIGFQIHTINGIEPHKKMKSQTCVYSLSQCMNILLKTAKVERYKYEIVHIFENMIDEPIMKFKGNPFTAVK
jgi:hypothetical protein